MAVSERHDCGCVTVADPDTALVGYRRACPEHRRTELPMSWEIPVYGVSGRSTL